MDEGEPQAPGAPLFEYRPARFGPMTVALLFILMIATPIAALDRLLAGRPVEGAYALLPLALLLLFAMASSPSPVLVYADRLIVSRSRLSRLLGAPTQFPWSDIESIYPSFYEDAGMKFSPFASAEGTAKHAGIRVEAADGARLTMEFTPAVLNLRRKGTAAYRDGLEVVRAARKEAGMPMVMKPPLLTDEQVDSMLAGAARPLLPFPITVTGIMAPALIIPALLTVVSPPGGLSESAMLGLVGLGLLPLISVFVLVNMRSRQRALTLHEVQKLREFQRETQAK